MLTDFETVSPVVPSSSQRRPKVRSTFNADLPLPQRGGNVPGCFWRYSEAFVDEPVHELKGKHVLEIFAGNGYLAALLAHRGIDIIAISRVSGHDAHYRGFFHPVQDIEALKAVFNLFEDRDLLLMSWPTTTRQAWAAARAWEKLRQHSTIFIGEITDYEQGKLGGCASDEFFKQFLPERELTSYGGGPFEKALVGRMRV